MKSIVLKVPQKNPEELNRIQEKEGLGNRISTITFLIKYYLLTKKSALDQSIDILDRLLDKLDVQKLPSAREQIKDV